MDDRHSLQEMSGVGSCQTKCLQYFFGISCQCTKDFVYKNKFKQTKGHFFVTSLFQSKGWRVSSCRRLKSRFPLRNKAKVNMNVKAVTKPTRVVNMTNKSEFYLSQVSEEERLRTKQLWNRESSSSSSDNACLSV